MATLEQLVIEFAADFSQFDAALNQASQKARAKIKNLESVGISPKVNLVQLHELNRLLDLKQRHLKETANLFAQTPITAKVDTSSVAHARQEVEEFKRSFKTMGGVKADGQATLKIKHEYKVDIRESNRDIANSLDKLARQLDNKGALRDIAHNTRRQAESSQSVDKKTKKEGFLTPIRQGLAQGLGQNLSQPFAEGFLTRFQETSGLDLTATGKFIGSALGNAEKAIVSYISKSTVKLVNSTGIKDATQNLGETFADSMVKAIEESTSVTELLTNLTQELNSNVGKFVEELKQVGNKLIDAGTYAEAMGVKAEKGQSILETPLARTIGNAVAPGLQKTLAARRGVMLDKSVPLVMERVQEIVADSTGKEGKVNVQKIQDMLQKGKGSRLRVMLGTDAPQVLTPETKELVITIGGYAGHKQAASGLRIAGDVVEEAYKQGRTDVAAIGVRNPDTDINPKTFSESKALGLLGSLAKPNLRGYSKDAVEIAAQAVAAIMQNPSIQIKILGESGGGFAAEEAVAILEAIGYGANVKGAGFGTPNFVGGVEAKNFQKFIGKNEAETLGYETHRVYAPLGLADVSSPEQNMTGLTGHPVEHYQPTAEYQRFVFGALPKIKTEDLKAVQQYIAQIQKTPGEITGRVRENLETMARQLKGVEAEGENSGQLEEVKTAITQLLNPKQENQVLLKYKNAISSLENLLPEAMLTAGDDNAKMLKAIVVDITRLQVEIQEQKRKADGTLLEDLTSIQEQLKNYRMAIGSLAKNPKTFKFDYIKKLAAEQSKQASEAQDLPQLQAINKDLNQFIKQITDDAQLNSSAEGQAIKKDLIAIKQQVIKSIKKIKDQAQSVAEQVQSVEAPTTDPWSSGFTLDAFDVFKSKTKKQKSSARNEWDIDPFEQGKAKPIPSKNIEALSALIKVNENILAEIRSFHKTIGALDKKNLNNKGGRLTRTNKVETIDGEFLPNEVSGGLALVQEQQKSAGIVGNILNGVANIAKQHYAIAKGIERYTFDTVRILSVGTVNLHAAKKVTQMSAFPTMLAIAGATNPAIGGTVGAVANSVVTPMLGAGLGAAGHLASGLLPDTLVQGAQMAGGFLSRIPGSGYVIQGLGQMGTTMLGGAGLGATYLLAGNAGTKGAQFLINQATKPLGLLPGSNAESTTYNTLSTAGNIVGGVYNALSGSNKPVPLALPPQRDAVKVEVMPPHLLQTYPLNPGANRALPAASSKMRDITAEVQKLESTIQNAISDDNLELIKNADNQIKKIGENLTAFYKQLKNTLIQGNLKLAKAQAQALMETQNFASEEIDKILEAMNSVGLNTALGTSSISSRLRGAKGPMTVRNNRAEKILNDIKEKEKTALYVNSLDTQGLIGEQVAKMSGKFDDTEIKQASQKLYHLFDQLHDVDLNSVGKNIIKGLRKGLLDESGQLDPVIKELAQGLPDEVKKILKIQSPSKVFEDIGRMIGEGLKKGIESTSQFVKGAIGNLFDNTNTDSVKPNFEGIKELAKANPIISGFIDKFEQAKNVVVKFGLAAAGGLGLLILTKALASAASEAVNVYRNFESIFIASKMIAGSEQYIARLRAQVQALGGDLESTMREGVQFVAGMQGTALEGQSQNIFLSADKALKSLGLQTQQYDSAILALKQVASKGKVSMEEISGQLGEAVPGSLNIAAKAMGTNVQGFIQMVESGNLLSEDFVPRFVAQLEAQTAFLAPEVQKSLNAKIGKFQANTTSLQVDIGARIAPNLAQIVDKAAGAVEFLTNNLNKAIFAAQTLAVALALPAANAGFAALVASVQSGTAAMSILTMATKGAQVAMVGLTKAFAPLALAAVLVGLVDGGLQLLKGTSEGVKEAQEQMAVTIERVTKAYEQAAQSQDKFLAKASKPPESSSWFLRGIDIFREGIGLGNFYGQNEMAENQKAIENTLNKRMQSVNLQRRNLFSPEETAQYLNQATTLKSQIDAIQGQAMGLQLTDPMGNAKQIAQLREQAAALQKEKERLDNRFLPGGEIGIEEDIKALKRLKDRLEALQATQGGDYSAQISEINGELTKQNKLLEMAREVNIQINNSLNEQRRAYIAMTSAQLQRQQDLEINYSQEKTRILEMQAFQQIGEKLTPQVTAQLEIAFNQSKFAEFTQAIQEGRNYIRKNLDANSQALVAELGGIAVNDLENINLEAVNRIKENLKDAGDKVKNVINDQVVSELEKLATAPLQAQQAKQAINEARVALLQADRDLADYYRELGRQFEDFFLGLTEQQLGLDQQALSFNRQLEDAQIQYVRENRQLQEDYSDLMADLAQQLRQAQNQIKDTQDKIRQVKFDKEILEIDLGNQNSFGRRLGAIFQDLFKSLDGNLSEGRNLEAQLAQVQREYVNTMRRIRSLQEQQADIERNRARQMVDLFYAEQQLLIAIQRAVRQLARQIEDFNVQVIRNLGTGAARPYLVNGNLNQPPIQRPGTPAINPNPIRSSGGAGGGGGGGGFAEMSQAPALNFGLTSSEMAVKTAGFGWVPQPIKDAWKFLEQKGRELLNRMQDTSRMRNSNRRLNNPLFNLDMDGKNTYYPVGQREALAQQYGQQLAERIAKLRGLQLEEVLKSVDKSFIQGLASGQKNQRIKLYGQSIPQQAFEEFVKLGGSQFVSPNVRSQPQPAPANNIVPTQTRSRFQTFPSQARPLPQPRPVQPPALPRRPAPDIQPRTAPAMTSGWNLPGLDFTAPVSGAKELLSVQTQSLSLQKELNELSKNMFVTTAIDQLKASINSMASQFRQMQREVQATKLSINDMIRGAKGYLTVQEEIDKVGEDIREQFDSQIFSLNERIRSTQNELDKLNEYNRSLTDQLNTRTDITDKQKQELQTLLSQNVAQASNVQKENDKLSLLKAQLEANKESSILAKQSFDRRRQELEILQAQSQIAVNLVEAQYRAGQAGMINQAGIMRAVMEGQAAIKQAEDLLVQKKISPEQLEMVKQTAKLNFDESINNAIPGLNEIISGLGEVIKGTKSWNETLKDVLNSIADIALQMLVLAPLRNMIGGVIGGSLGLGNTSAIAPASINGGGFLGGILSGIGSLFRFTQGGMVDTYPMGGKIPYYAAGGPVSNAFNQERAISGKAPRLIVAHDGEQVLSTLNGDAQLWRALKRTGRWDDLKSPRINAFAFGGTVGAMPTQGGAGQGSNTIIVNQNYRITTPDADSFRKSRSQMAVEEANRTRRVTQRNS